jgi:hypothetical protein
MHSGIRIQGSKSWSKEARVEACHVSGCWMLDTGCWQKAELCRSQSSIQRPASSGQSGCVSLSTLASDNTQSSVTCSTSRRRRAALRAICFRYGRLLRRLLTPKSFGLLMVHSVRQARFSLKYCLMSVDLYSTCRLGETPRVMMRERELPGVLGEASRCWILDSGC